MSETRKGVHYGTGKITYSQQIAHGILKKKKIQRNSDQ